MPPAPGLNDVAFMAFVDEYRVRCLWFLRQDYYPVTASECESVLRLIEQHGDRLAFLRAAEFRQWLSPRFNDRSVDC